MVIYFALHLETWHAVKKTGFLVDRLYDVSWFLLSGIVLRH